MSTATAKAATTATTTTIKTQTQTQTQAQAQTAKVMTTNVATTSSPASQPISTNTLKRPRETENKTEGTAADAKSEGAKAGTEEKDKAAAAAAAAGGGKVMSAVERRIMEEKQALISLGFMSGFEVVEREQAEMREKLRQEERNQKRLKRWQSLIEKQKVGEVEKEVMKKREKMTGSNDDPCCIHKCPVAGCLRAFRTLKGLRYHVQTFDHELYELKGLAEMSNANHFYG